MPCKECEHSFYPESLSEHRFIPTEFKDALKGVNPESWDHYCKRFAIQKITLTIIEEETVIVTIPRYPDIHMTNIGNFYRINCKKHIGLIPKIKSLIGCRDKKIQEEARIFLSSLHENQSLRVSALSCIG